MPSSQATVRIEEFERERNRRTITHLQRSIEDFERLAAHLDSEIRAEEERTRISDPSLTAYSTFAKAARVRRDNLLRSRDELILHLKSLHTPFDEYREAPYAA